MNEQNSAITFDARDIRAMERAMDALRDHQLRGAMFVQAVMEQTPAGMKEVWTPERSKELIAEWDNQMSYWGLFTGLSKALGRCADLCEGGKYVLELKKVEE